MYLALCFVVLNFGKDTGSIGKAMAEITRPQIQVGLGGQRKTGKATDSQSWYSQFFGYFFDEEGVPLPKQTPVPANSQASIEAAFGDFPPIESQPWFNASKSKNAYRLNRIIVPDMTDDLLTSRFGDKPAITPTSFKKATDDAVSQAMGQDTEPSELSFSLPKMGIMSRPSDYTVSTGGSPKYKDIATRLVSDFMTDFDLTKEQAAALAGNLAFETSDFSTLQEVNPMVKGSKGGTGYAMFTGDRRVAFEKWVEDNELDPSSYEANYGYLKKELSEKDDVIGNIGKKTIQKLKDSDTLEDATSIVEEYYLRPGIPHSERRQDKAKDVLALLNNKET